MRRREQFARELEEEMQLHAELRAEKLQQSGLSQHEADLEARRRFGNRTRHEEDSREEWTWVWLESLLQDARYAMRTFRRAPLFACGTAATIGLGIGVTCCFFAVFNAYVLRPFAVHDPYSLYEFEWRTKAAGRQGFSWAELEHLRSDGAVFSEIIASSSTFAFLDGRPSRGRLVTGNYFAALGITPALGRILLPDDAATPGAQPVVMLSHSAWKNQFAGDPNIIGRKITLRGYPFEVVGVMRPEFRGVENSSLKDYGPDFWAPITMSRQFSAEDSFGPAGRNSLSVIGRLQPGMTEKSAKAALESYVRNLWADLPADQEPFRFSLNSRATPIPLTPDLLAALTLILAIFGLVLLIACANVANMMLARALARQREIGVRLSLGAGHSRLVRQLLTEAILLALPGAAIGFVIAFAAARSGPHWFLAAIHAPTFATTVRLPSFDPDVRVFVFACAAATLSAIGFGLAPALQATRWSSTGIARSGLGSEPRSARLRNALVIMQVTVCVLFLITSALLMRGSRDMANRNTGMELSHVVFATGTATVGSDSQITRRDRLRIADQLRAQPWVEQIATSARPPLGLGVPVASVMPSGSRNQATAEYNYVSPEYFQALHIPLKRGRSFTKEESDAGFPVVVVSESAALRLWPKQDPIGESLTIEGVPGSNRTARDRSCRKRDQRMAIRPDGYPLPVLPCWRPA
jgi:predicted permease